MGMYTGLRFHVKLNELGVKVLEKLIENSDEDSSYNRWDLGELQVPLEIYNFKNFSRCNFIPFGEVYYMPDDWEWKNNYNKEESTWEVCCSLKNYNNEIEYFWDQVIPYIVSNVYYAEMLYEEFENPIKLELKGE